MRLGGIVVAVVALVALLMGAMALASAQSPPARVYGTVTVNGSAPPAGTLVEAFVGDRVCGSGEVRDLGAPIGIGFVVDVNSDAFVPGCAREGTTVSFKVGGVDAAETVMFQTGAFIQQNLTAQGQPASPPPVTATPPPSPSPTPAGASPAPAATASPSPSPSPSVTPSPAGSPAASPEGTATPTTTASPSASPIGDSVIITAPPVGSGADDGDGGVPAGVWLALGAGLLAGAGVAAYLYFRNRSVPPA